MSYPLAGAGWPNQVIETMTAGAWGLRPPLSAEQIRKHNIDIVYTSGRKTPLFGPDVVYETVYDDTRDPNRVTGTPACVYRVNPRQGIAGHIESQDALNLNSAGPIADDSLRKRGTLGCPRNNVR